MNDLDRACLLRPLAPFLYRHEPIEYGVSRSDVESYESGERHAGTRQAIYYNLWICRDGVVTLSSTAGQWRLTAGQIGLTEPGMTVDLSAGSYADRWTFDLQHRQRRIGKAGVPEPASAEPQPCWKELFGRPLPVMVSQQLQDQTSDLFEQIRYIYRMPGGGPGDWLRANAMLHAWVVDHAANDGGLQYQAPDCNEDKADAAGTNFAARVDWLIRGHMRSGASLKSIAQLLNISTRTLRDRYYKERGISFRETRRRLRLDVAKFYLSTSCTVAEVARKCGMRSQAAFSTWFKQEIGRSPLQWKQEQARQSIGIDSTHQASTSQ